MPEEQKAKLEPRRLFEIAVDIEENWGATRTGVNFAARPYLDAMKCLEEIDEMYGADSASSVVVYFLSNAMTWRGAKAREIKLELKALLSTSKGKGQQCE